MGILSKLFGGGSSREDWGARSLCISEGLEGVRKTWFDHCVRIIRESSTKKSADFLKIKIINTQLGGEADLAIKAYQLYCVSGFLAQHAYISPSEGKDFADILYAQVCGTQLKECSTFFMRYHEVQSDTGTQLFRFASDVVKYIIGNESPVAESMLIASTVPTFVASNHIVLASCFGDDKTAKKLESKLNKN